MTLYPWPKEPKCILNVPDDPSGVGWLTYSEPDTGRRASLPVTRGSTRAPTEEFPYPVWHVETPKPDVAITTPSIRVSTTRPTSDGRTENVEIYHSPYRTVWCVVEELED